MNSICSQPHLCTLQHLHPAQSAFNTPPHSGPFAGHLRAGSWRSQLRCRSLIQRQTPHGAWRGQGLRACWPPGCGGP
eukprot:scaffold113247_cov15-Tisochrysis_lutea.AAC.1